MSIHTKQLLHHLDFMEIFSEVLNQTVYMHRTWCRMKMFTLQCVRQLYVIVYILDMLA